MLPLMLRAKFQPKSGHLGVSRSSVSHVEHAQAFVQRSRQWIPVMFRLPDSTSATFCRLPIKGIRSSSAVNAAFFRLVLIVFCGISSGCKILDNYF